LNPGDANPLLEANGEALEVVAVVEPGRAGKVEFDVRGVSILYRVAQQELEVHGHRAAAPLRDGKIDVRILADRTAFEVFAGGGQVYVPMPVLPRDAHRAVGVAVEGGPARFHTLVAYELKSLWDH
jgi:sucrose-6-phosphate hydrolase SacC (GH32 family)